MIFKLVWKDPREPKRLINVDSLKELVKEVNYLIDEYYDKFNSDTVKQTICEEVHFFNEPYHECHHVNKLLPRYNPRYLVHVYYKNRLIGSIQHHFYTYPGHSISSIEPPPDILQDVRQFFKWNRSVWLPESQLKQISDPYLEIL